jgi:hypothetical protein
MKPIFAQSEHILRDGIHIYIQSDQVTNVFKKPKRRSSQETAAIGKIIPLRFSAFP